MHKQVLIQIIGFDLWPNDSKAIGIIPDPTALTWNAKRTLAFDPVTWKTIEIIPDQGVSFKSVLVTVDTTVV